MKKGQVALISAVMIIVLVILAVLLSGYLFYDRTTISVRETTGSGVFYMKFLDYDVSLNTQYDEGDCCYQYTYTNYHMPEKPSEEVVYLDNYYYVPACNSCNVPKTYTMYTEDVMVKEDIVYLDNMYHVPACSSCNVPKTYTRYYESSSVDNEVVYLDNYYYVKSCCC